MTSAASSAAGAILGEIARRIHTAVATVAATQPDPLDPFRGLYISDEEALGEAAEARDGAGGGAGADAIEAAARQLGLDTLDTAVLAFCAAPELDARYGRLVAYLHDDVTKRLPTPRLVARLLAGEGLTERSVLTRFGAGAPLRRTGAVRLLGEDPALPLADRPAKLDDALAARIVGADIQPAAGGRRERLVPVPSHDPGRPDTARAIRDVVAAGPGIPLLVCGTDAPELLAWALDRPLLIADARDLADEDRLGAARLRATLEGAELVLELPRAPSPEERDRVRSAFDLHGEHPLACAERRDDVTALDGLAPMIVEIPAMTTAEREACWRAAAGEDAAVAGAAAKFRLSTRQIEHAAVVAKLSARARGADAAEAADLERGAREASRTRLGELAILLETGRSWSELVLPEAQREQLRAVSGYLRHRDRVLSEWGYEESVAGQGLSVLFAGESGTGKTMAAQVVATELGLDVFRVDLATVVSKYIGETERNLDRIFAAAEGSNAILFFDEADALFGKRSEVKDAHDRYANIEVSYLLQRMETYPGAVVLATNYRRNIDDAFLRRLDFTIDFPFPEPADRARIWERLLPSRAPVGEDVDVQALASRFELSGGSIRNCSVAAAFRAADDGGTIGMDHLVHAIAAEYRKNGRLTLDAEFGTPPRR